MVICVLCVVLATHECIGIWFYENTICRFTIKYYKSLLLDSSKGAFAHLIHHWLNPMQSMVIRNNLWCPCTHSIGNIHILVSLQLWYPYTHARYSNVHLKLNCIPVVCTHDHSSENTIDIEEISHLFNIKLVKSMSMSLKMKIGYHRCHVSSTICQQHEGDCFFSWHTSWTSLKPRLHDREWLQHRSTSSLYRKLLAPCVDIKGRLRHYRSLHSISDSKLHNKDGNCVFINKFVRLEISVQNYYRRENTKKWLITERIKDIEQCRLYIDINIYHYEDLCSANVGERLSP